MLAWVPLLTIHQSSQCWLSLREVLLQTKGKLTKLSYFVNSDVIRKLKTTKVRSNVMILILAITGIFSCKQSNESTPDTAEAKTLDSLKNIRNKESINNKDIYTKFEYIDSKNKKIIIQNGFPRSGMKYTDTKGSDYNYAIFWTQLINETDNTIELNLNIPVDLLEIPSLQGKYYEVLIPRDTMTVKKFPLFLYSLTNLESFF
jgi:hypothetical protein